MIEQKWICALNESHRFFNLSLSAHPSWQTVWYYSLYLIASEVWLYVCLHPTLVSPSSVLCRGWRHTALQQAVLARGMCARMKQTKPTTKTHRKSVWVLSNMQKGFTLQVWCRKQHTRMPCTYQLGERWSRQRVWEMEIIVKLHTQRKAHEKKPRKGEEYNHTFWVLHTWDSKEASVWAENRNYHMSDEEMTIAQRIVMQTVRVERHEGVEDMIKP